MFKVGKQYNFFDDGKISTSRHYIATVVDIIPINEFNNYEFIMDSISDSKWLNLYDENPKEVVVCTIPSFCKGYYFFTKEKYSNIYFSHGSSYWGGALYPTEETKKLIENKYINNELKQELII